jgi:hypothetical protein
MSEMPSGRLPWIDQNGLACCGHGIRGKGHVAVTVAA